MVSVRSETNNEKQGQRSHPENRRVAAPRFVLLGYLCATRQVYSVEGADAVISSVLAAFNLRFQPDQFGGNLTAHLSTGSFSSLRNVLK